MRVTLARVIFLTTVRCRGVPLFVTDSSIMLRGIFALFFRSLRSESRSFWIHFSRFFLLLMFYFGLAIAQEQAERGERTCS